MRKLLKFCNEIGVSPIDVIGALFGLVIEIRKSKWKERYIVKGTSLEKIAAALEQRGDHEEVRRLADDDDDDDKPPRPTAKAPAKK